MTNIKTDKGDMTTDPTDIRQINIGIQLYTYTFDNLHEIYQLLEKSDTDGVPECLSPFLEIPSVMEGTPKYWE